MLEGYIADALQSEGLRIVALAATEKSAALVKSEAYLYKSAVYSVSPSLRVRETTKWESCRFSG